MWLAHTQAVVLLFGVRHSRSSQRKPCPRYFVRKLISVGKKKKIPTPLYHEYISSAAWLKKRMQTYWCLGKVCEVCGSSKKTHVHHNNYESLGNEKIFRDLVILCESCHDAFHEVVPSQELGKESVWYRKKCSLCMRKNKLTEYLSCSTYRRTKDQKERKKRTLRICKICAQAFPQPLLSENKNAVQKEKLEQLAKKKEAKRKGRKNRCEHLQKRLEFRSQDQMAFINFHISFFTFGMSSSRVLQMMSKSIPKYS